MPSSRDRQPRPDPSGAPEAPPELSPARRWAFRLASALLLPALLLVLLEVALRVAGVGFEPAFTIPCQLDGRPAACDNPDFTRRFFPPGVGRSPSPLVIPLDKGPRTFRIFVLGESAAQGDPEPAFAFSRFLEVQLEARFPQVRFEIFNAGVVAINSHVILPATRDLARLQPDLFIVYAGNNEVVGPFGRGTVLTSQRLGLAAIRAAVALSSTRVGQLLTAVLRRGSAATQGGWRGMEMFLSQQVPADDPGLEAVYRNFEANLRDIVAAARASGAPVLLSTVGTRLLGCAPFASAHRPGLSLEALQRWEERVAAGEAAERAGRPAEARTAWLEAEAIDPGHAALQYRLGRAALAAGDAREAGVRLARARDLDTLRFRADSRIEAIIRAVAASSGPGVRLVDGAAAVASLRPDGLTDGRGYVEHVHLTPEGNHALAARLYGPVVEAMPVALRAATAATSGIPGPSTGGPAAGGAPPLSLEAASARLALTGYDRYRIAKAVLQRLERPPFTTQLDHDLDVAELTAQKQAGAAEPYQATEDAYRAALARAPDDAWLHFDFGVLLDNRDVHLARRGQPDPGRAAPEYQRALALRPRWSEAGVRLAELWLRTGRTAEAIDQCRRLIAERPRQGQPWVTMGWALAREGRRGEAIEAFQRAARLDPATAGEAQEAVRRLEAAP